MSWANTVPLDGSITQYQVEGLDSGTLYSWSIDEVQADGTITYGPVWSFTTADACTPTSLGSYVVTDTIRGAAGTSYGVAYVTVVDNCGNLIHGASVTGRFTGDFGETYTETTGTDGVAVFTTTTSIKKPSFGFTVESID
jgi:hypothetical protein